MTASAGIRAAYTGTFDPITNGHADVIRRAAKLFPTLYVAVAQNTSKKSIFDPEERIQLARETLADLDNVTVVGTQGLVVDFARDYSVTVLVRGVRGVGDYEYERQMAIMNQHLEPELETVLLAPSPQFAHISSTLVREIALFSGDISGLVPPEVTDALARKSDV